LLVIDDDIIDNQTVEESQVDASHLDFRPQRLA